MAEANNERPDVETPQSEQNAVSSESTAIGHEEASDTVSPAAGADEESTAANDASDTADDAASAETADAASNDDLAAQEAEERLLVLFQSTVYGPNDEKIGKVGQVYLDDQTQEPNWVTVKTGLFGTKEFFVPLDLAERYERRINVPYSKSQVTAAPHTEIDQSLSPEEEDTLYEYYEVPDRTTGVSAKDAAESVDEETAETPLMAGAATDDREADERANADEQVTADNASDSAEPAVVTDSPDEAAANEAASELSPVDQAIADSAANDSTNEPIDYSAFAPDDAAVEEPDSELSEDDKR